MEEDILTAAYRNTVSAEEPETEAGRALMADWLSAKLPSTWDEYGLPAHVRDIERQAVAAYLGNDEPVHIATQTILAFRPGGSATDLARAIIRALLTQQPKP